MNAAPDLITFGHQRQVDQRFVSIRVRLEQTHNSLHALRVAALDFLHCVQQLECVQGDARAGARDEVGTRTSCVGAPVGQLNLLLLLPRLHLPCSWRRRNGAGAGG